MEVPAWLLVLSRFLICVGAGEVAIRYTAWTYTLLRTKERFAALPILVGVAWWAANRFGVEFSWIIALGQKDNAGKFASLVEDDIMSEVFRVGIISALCWLTYPVTKMVYRQSWEQAVIEGMVRAFLITVSLIAGYMIAYAQIYRG